jgi:hypothetical protein
VSDGDAFAVLGLEATATLAEVREARRRLAFELHPDHGGDVGSMQRLNAAFAACVAHVTNRRPLPAPTSAPQPPPGSQARAPTRQRGPAPRRLHVEQDAPSFTIDALPAEAFEALLVVASWIGEVIDDDPPYVLECQLDLPVRCWCRLELVPDAGGSTVSLTVGSMVAPVSAEMVRDVWVEQLNLLGRPLP